MYRYMISIIAFTFMNLLSFNYTLVMKVNLELIESKTFLLC